ncbi:MAG: hypothetical protein V4736_16040 [Bdellovibrionota bacterium]
MERMDLPWEKVAFFICEKCGKSIDKPKGGDDDLAGELKSHYRSELKEIDLHKKVRVMVSGCLNICEKGKQAAALFDKDKNESFAITFDPYEQREEILDLLRFRAGVKNP